MEYFRKSGHLREINWKNLSNAEKEKLEWNFIMKERREDSAKRTKVREAKEQTSRGRALSRA